jgi:hypothetical protein
MANTYVEIGSVSGNGSNATLEFTSIPATYTDLAVKLSLRGTLSGSGGYFSLRFNSLTTNLSGRYIQGLGSGTPVSSTFVPWGKVCDTSTTANTFASTDIYIPNYAGSSYKSISIDTVTENNATAADAVLVAGLWSSTAAISSIQIVISAGAFANYSTATLYGISKS